MAFFDRGYALVVSIANYRNLPRLPQSVSNDAHDLCATLTDPAYGGYRPEQVRRLADDEATGAGIRASLGWLAGQTDRYDTVLIYFSGHGGRLESGPQAGEYFLPVETEPADLAQTAIDGAELAGLLSYIKAVRLVVVFDCCRGSEDNRRRLQEAIPGFKPGLAESYYGRLAVTQGRVVLAASRSDEMAWDMPETRNSLFMHCLLQGLQGQVRTHEDGLIRIFDLFKFTAQEVTGRQPRQQPQMAAKVDTNFPVALYRGGARFIDPDRPHPSLHLSFPPQASAVLTMMFPENRRLIVERELAGDARGGQLFLIRPIQQSGGQEPMAVVKLAAAPLIEQEWRAYRRYFYPHLPGSAAVTRLVLVPGSGWGGLRYHLGQGEKPAVETYLNYCQRASLDDVISTMQDRLLKILGRLVQPSRTVFSFSLQYSYDEILPVNLLVKPGPAPAGAARHIVRPTRLPGQPLQRGDYVRLQGFTVTGQDRLRQTVVLNGQPPSFAVALEVAEPATAYHIHQVIDEIEGMVIDTRHERLQTELQAALGPGIDLTAPGIPGPGGAALPNPLAGLAALLQERPAVKVGCIHGDMAMDKILIDPGSRDISLIDFAAVREDHVLHDFLCLETDVVTGIIPDILAASRTEVWSVCDFLRQVHQSVANNAPPAAEQLVLPALEKPLRMLMAIRQAARPYLLAADNWGEYYQGLLFYLLGACGAQNQREPGVAPTPLARQVAFWAAATVRVLLIESEVSPSSK